MRQFFIQVIDGVKHLFLCFLYMLFCICHN
jgi:hypothetical protein